MRADHARVKQSLAEVGFQTAVGLLATYAAQARDLQPWMRDAQINTDRNQNSVISQKGDAKPVQSVRTRNENTNTDLLTNRSIKQLWGSGARYHIRICETDLSS